MRNALTILALVVLVVVNSSALILPYSRHMASRNHHDFFQPHFEVPTTANKPTTDQMVDCAEQGECSLEEIDLMIQELEEKNEDSKKVLKYALTLQRELASLKGVLRDMDDTVEERTTSVRDTEDHSFQHYVDYKGIGAYESH